MKEEMIALHQFREALRSGSDVMSRDIDEMDDSSKERHRHHMKAAHHKFMAQHYKRKMYKK